MKFIIITGGVLSGLGKGVTAASLGFLLKGLGFRVTAMKCDMYLNIDAGTMNPVEHGEVFVTHDGVETDQDLGHYERFLNIILTKDNYVTNGQVYKAVLDKERQLVYEGKCVEPYHHIPPEIIDRWYKAGLIHKSDIVIVELGGTVGEYEGLLFMESVRRLKLKVPDDVVLVHVGYLPTPPSIGELKSKPLQQSVSLLNSVGLQPDFIIGRAEKEIDLKRKEKIFLATGVAMENIISNPDLETIYKVPLVLEKQKFHLKVIRKLKLKPKKTPNFSKWNALLNNFEKAKGSEVKIAIVGKYQKTGDYTLEDSYISVVESLKHAAWRFKHQPKIVWIDSEKLETINAKDIPNVFAGAKGIIVPQGWGKRGVEGKIKAANYARNSKVPYLGLCFGMQMATIEFARNAAGLKGANSEEVDPKTPYPVIHIMPNQRAYLEKQQYGATIRLGAWPCVLKKGTKLYDAYKRYGGVKNSPNLIYERHRHRFEFNLKYKKLLQKKGFVICGVSPDGKLVEAIEVGNHPFYVGTQFHPEYISTPLFPHPVFMAFLKACLAK